jgi:DNA-binding transcriptional ArsR family regulator
MRRDLATVFAALGDPTRLAIIERLSHGEVSVQALSAPFEISPPAISRHLKVLEQAGLVIRSRAGKERPCALNPDGMRKVADWTQQMRRFWDESFDRMDDYLAKILANTTNQGE